MTNENKNIYWNAACEISYYKYGVCRVLTHLEGAIYGQSIFAKAFANYFLPSIIESWEYHSASGYWMESVNQSSEKDQLDRFVALLLMHEIYNDPDFVEVPNPEFN